MKKKIALFLSVLSCVLMLGACGTDSTTVDYNGYSYNDLYNQTYSAGTALGGYSEDVIEQQMMYFEAYDAETYALDIELCEKWLAVMDECGEYVGVVDDSFSIDKAGKTLTTSLTLEFEERNVVFQLVYNYYDMSLTGITIDPVYTLGEKMVTAGMNTLICMGVVFLVLIGICLLISCFKIFPYLEEKKKEQANAEKTLDSKDAVVTQIEQREEQELSDDTELVAVIAAAIAAYEGTSTSDFVVRSIIRR